LIVSPGGESIELAALTIGPGRAWQSAPSPIGTGQNPGESDKAKSFGFVDIRLN